MWSSPRLLAIGRHGVSIRYILEEVDRGKNDLPSYFFHHPIGIVGGIFFQGVFSLYEDNLATLRRPTKLLQTIREEDEEEG